MNIETLKQMNTSDVRKWIENATEESIKQLTGNLCFPAENFSTKFQMLMETNKPLLNSLFKRETFQKLIFYYVCVTTTFVYNFLICFTEFAFLLQGSGRSSPCFVFAIWWRRAGVLMTQALSHNQRIHYCRTPQHTRLPRAGFAPHDGCAAAVRVTRVSTLTFPV